MASKKKAKAVNAVRYRAARADAKVSTICRRIERDYKLPEGSVCLLLADGKRKARGDKRVLSLLNDWDYFE